MGVFDFFSREKKQKLDQGLEKTKSNMFSKMTKAVAGKTTVDEEVLDELEEVLVSADVGVDTTVKVIESIEERVKRDKYFGTNELNNILREEVAKILEGNEIQDQNPFNSAGQHKKPYVIMVVGVNGVGKTTTIGKLAHQYKQAGNKVVLGAADTFRAAAIDQLTVWAERVDVPIVKKEMGSDPASVAFDSVKSGVANDADVVIIDTAGRLHNKVNLMNELSKVKKVMKKMIEDAPHEVLLILDASTGQNAIAQAKEFTNATEVNSIALTKLDGTAKGGVVLGVADQFNIPVKYIGVGEKMEDLQVFNKEEFVDSLFSKEESE